MGINPTVCHMNEGHAAFMALEKIRELKNNSNMSFEEAVEASKAGNVFTIHTPVKAGLDEFRVELMDKYFGDYFPKLGINRDRFLSLGRILPDDREEAFKMPILAIKLSAYTNGVSELHGHVSRGIWGSMWPGIPLNEVPITSVTNGIHLENWLADEMESLYERYIGPTGRMNRWMNPSGMLSTRFLTKRSGDYINVAKSRLIVFATQSPKSTDAAQRNISYRIEPRGRSA